MSNLPPPPPPPTTVVPGVTRWQYKVEQWGRPNAGGPAWEQWLNEIGQHGWELVSVAGSSCVFKRPAQV